MAQAGYTPIQLYYSTTTSNVPSAGNLASGELAINITDGKLFYKDNGGVVRVIAQTSSVTNVASISFGTTGLTPSTATTGAVTVAGTLATTNGGTGLTSFTANGVVYASSTSALTTGSALTFDGTNFATTGSGTVKNLLLTAGTLPGAGNPSISLRSADNVVYHQSGSANTIVMLDSAQNTMQSIGATAQIWNISNAEQMRLTSTGLGIGTSSPSQKLHVVAAGGYNATFSENSANNVRLQFYIDANETALVSGYNTTAKPMTFYTGGSLRATLDSSGNLGIGTSSPSTKLDVRGSSVGGNFSAISVDNTAGGSGSPANTVSINFSNAGVVKNSITGAVYGDGYLAFATNDNTEKMRLTASGNLGIGTSSPTGGRLHVTQVSGSAIFGTTAGGTGYGGSFQNTDGGTTKFFRAAGAGGNGVFSAGVDSTTQLLLDTSGNLGLGVTPSAWSTGKALELGFLGNALWGNAADEVIVSQNAYFNSGWKYATSRKATHYSQYDAQHRWFTAPSGTAGNAISWTQAMTLDASGRLLLGTTSAYYAASGRGEINLNASSDNIFGFLIGGNPYAYIYTSTSEFRLASATSIPTTFYTNNTERARITSVGNFSLGGSADRGTTVGTNAIQIFNGTAPAGTLTNGVSLYSSSGDLRFMDAAGNAYQVGFRNVPQSGSAKTGSYTLATTDVGEFIQISTGGSITIPTSTFSAGDVVSLFNNTSGNITITCSALTAYIAGTDTIKTSMTLATRGVATVLFITATLCVVTGNVS